MAWRDEEGTRYETEGTVPDGFYGLVIIPELLLKYCCRDDGDHATAIALPHRVAFLLFRKGGKCQRVIGMNVSEVKVKWSGVYVCPTIVGLECRTHEKKTKSVSISDEAPDLEPAGKRTYNTYYCHYSPVEQ